MLDFLEDDLQKQQFYSQYWVQIESKFEDEEMFDYKMALFLRKKEVSVGNADNIGIFEGFVEWMCQ